MPDPAAYKNIMVTGGAGFIGSNFVDFLMRSPDFDGKVVVVDKLTYAGNPDNMRGFPADRVEFARMDVADPGVAGLINDLNVDAICHFAAESHVDRSIIDPNSFIRTNVDGTLNMLESARRAWKGRRGTRFHHVSTDEVYGSLKKDDPPFTESSPYDPHSPYSASKAASDHMVRAYRDTHGLPVTISNCSNNYGPRQFPEKLIPVVISKAIEGEPIPVYGKGDNVRDWLYVEDHCSAIWRIMTLGRTGETYNIGGDSERSNIDMILMICDVVDSAIGDGSRSRDLIEFVRDRPGHDFRYAIDHRKLTRETGWRSETPLDAGIVKTVEWYMSNKEWCDRIRSGEYRSVGGS